MLLFGYVVIPPRKLTRRYLIKRPLPNPNVCGLVTRYSTVLRITTVLCFCIKLLSQSSIFGFLYSRSKSKFKTVHGGLVLKTYAILKKMATNNSNQSDSANVPLSLKPSRRIPKPILGRQTCAVLFTVALGSNSVGRAAGWNERAL